MITTDMIGKIRRLHVRDKLSEREIARMTGLSRNTMSKWLREPVAEAPRYRREARPNKLSAFEASLRQAVTADARRPSTNDARHVRCMLRSRRQATAAATRPSPTSFERGAKARGRRSTSRPTFP